MRFDYIRALDPSEEPLTPLEPVVSIPPPPPIDADEAKLEGLISSVRDEVAANEGVPARAAVPAELPSFLGVSLSSAWVEPARVPVASPATSSHRGPSAGVVTMSIAVVAAVIFGALVLLL